MRLFTNKILFMQPSIINKLNVLTKRHQEIAELLTNQKIINYLSRKINRNLSRDKKNKI